MLKIGGNLVPLYDTPPKGNFQVEELEELLSMRNTLLMEIDDKLQQDKTNYSGANHTTKLTIGGFTSSLNSIEEKFGWNGCLEQDKTSHFILSLAFCKNEQDRIWFASRESKLFMARLDYYQIDLEEVLKMLNIPLERQEDLSEDFLAKIRFRDKQNTIPSAIFRIPFEFGLNLIASMFYYLHKGFVYISKNEIYQIIETVFKENLLKKLTLINRNLDRILYDSRIRFLINTFTTRREVETLSKNVNYTKNENISFKDIDGLAEKAFPLCMQLLNRGLTTDGHIKHWGRLQYNLFLKGMGLSLDDALTFLRNKFSKTKSGDKFDKEYAYNIRHSYGKEGKRNDYIPYSCNKIQTGLPPPNSGEHHGCPFKVFSDDKLKKLLYEFKMKELDVLKIMEKSKNKEPSVSLYICLIFI